MDKKIGASFEPNETAFNKAHNTSLPLFPWFELPENARRLNRFTIGMQGTQNMASPSVILEGELPEYIRQSVLRCMLST